MYAQTIAYGLLSARIANPESETADDLAAHMPVTNPFLKELMETFLHVGGRPEQAEGPGIDFDELGVSEVVDLLDDTNMEAVLRDFGDRNPQEDPVIHFYELSWRNTTGSRRFSVASSTLRARCLLHRPLRRRASPKRVRPRDGLADTTTWADLAQRRPDLMIPTG